MVLLVLGYDKNTPIASWNAYMKGCMLIYLFIDERTPLHGESSRKIFFFFTLITHSSVTTQHSFIVKTQYSSKKWNKV